MLPESGQQAKLPISPLSASDFGPHRRLFILRQRYGRLVLSSHHLLAPPIFRRGRPRAIRCAAPPRSGQVSNRLFAFGSITLLSLAVQPRQRVPCCLTCGRGAWCYHAAEQRPTGRAEGGKTAGSRLISDFLPSLNWTMNGQPIHCRSRMPAMWRAGARLEGGPASCGTET